MTKAPMVHVPKSHVNRDAVHMPNDTQTIEGVLAPLVTANLSMMKSDTPLARSSDDEASFCSTRSGMTSGSSVGRDLQNVASRSGRAQSGSAPGSLWQ